MQTGPSGTDFSPSSGGLFHCILLHTPVYLLYTPEPANQKHTEAVRGLQDLNRWTQPSGRQTDTQGWRWRGDHLGQSALSEGHADPAGGACGVNTTGGGCEWPRDEGAAGGAF